MKISLIQMNSQSDRNFNLSEAKRLMQQAVETENPKLIILPEHFEWSGGTTEQKRAAADTIPGGAAYKMVQAFAEANNVWVHAGSVFETIAGSDRIYNTTVVFNNRGEEVGIYRKMHLFDIETPDGQKYLESASVERGDELFIYEIEGMRVACAICYDIRFSRLFDRLAAEGVDLFVLPAAFTLQTGKDHWEILCRSRAIEFQAYFAACGQWGGYRSKTGKIRHSYGNSLVCDPWGQVIARASDNVDVLTTRVEPAKLEAVRELIPMEQHRLEMHSVEVKTA